MSKPIVRWIIAIGITLGAAVYQRVTGPTHPMRGAVEIDGERVSYRLPRSHGGEGDQEVALAVPAGVQGELSYRHYPTDEPWVRIPMTPKDGQLVAPLPHQPPAGKLEYSVTLIKGAARWQLPERNATIIRFRGGVPAGILVPHVLCMFLAMLFSALAALEALVKSDRVERYVLWTVGVLFAGGLVLGPIVQKYAFGELWTGIPYGYDLTDNKTLIAALFWLGALIMVLRKAPQARYWVMTAALVLLVIFSIPHSALGSQLDYASGKIKTGSLLEPSARVRAT